MSTRKIEPLEFNGQTIYVEVTEVDSDKALEKQDDGFEKTSTDSKLISAGDQLRSVISALANTVDEALEKTSPSEWTLEVNLGFEGKAGIPFITEGGVNGAVKVSVTWKRG